MAIVVGLNLGCVQRLKKTWEVEPKICISNNLQGAYKAVYPIISKLDRVYLFIWKLQKLQKVAQQITAACSTLFRFVTSARNN
jgi:hypothetical protein